MSTNQGLNRTIVKTSVCYLCVRANTPNSFSNFGKNLIFLLAYIFFYFVFLAQDYLDKENHVCSCSETGRQCGGMVTIEDRPGLEPIDPVGMTS